MALNIKSIQRTVSRLLVDEVTVYRSISDKDTETTFDPKTGLYQTDTAATVIFEDPDGDVYGEELYAGRALITTTTQEPRNRIFGDVQRLESPYRLRIPVGNTEDIHNNDIVRITASQAFSGLVGREFLVKQEIFGTYVASRQFHLTLREHYVDL